MKGEGKESSGSKKSGWRVSRRNGRGNGRGEEVRVNEVRGSGQKE